MILLYLTWSYSFFRFVIYRRAIFTHIASIFVIYRRAIFMNIARLQCEHEWNMYYVPSFLSHSFIDSWLKTSEHKVIDLTRVDCILAIKTHKMLIIVWNIISHYLLTYSQKIAIFHKIASPFFFFWLKVKSGFSSLH